MNTWLPGFFGAHNLHPMVVHFPIAFWVGALCVWTVASLGHGREDWWRFGRWLHLMGLLGALVAVLFGFIASDRLGHDTPGHDLVHTHRDFMLVTTGISLLVCAVGWKMRHASLVGRRVLTALTCLLVGVMMWGTDRGAALVYVHGVGVQAPLHDINTQPELPHDHGEHAH